MSAGEKIYYILVSG